MRACGDLLPEGLDRLLSDDGPAPSALLGRPAVTVVHHVDVHAVETVLDQPLGRRWPSLSALAALSLPSFLVCNPSVDERQLAYGLLLYDSPGEAQRVEAGQRARFVHTFDIRGYAAHQHHKGGERKDRRHAQ